MKSTSPTTTCPQCGRTVKTHTNRFGDVIINRHMTGSYADKTLDGQHPTNRAAYSASQITCPGSNEPAPDPQKG